MPQAKRETLSAGPWPGSGEPRAVERAPWAGPATVVWAPKEEDGRKTQHSRGDGDRVGYFPSLPAAEGALAADTAPGDPLLEGEWTEALAVELHAFAVAAEADIQFAAALRWFVKEMKVWMHLASQGSPDSEEGRSAVRRHCVEVLRCCEAAGRCLSLEGFHEDALAMHHRALRCADRGGIPADEPSVAGAKVAAADCHIHAAIAAEHRRAQLAATSETAPERRDVGTEEWRARVRQAEEDRNQRVQSARALYTDAAIAYRVALALGKPGSAAPTEDCVDDGPYAPHISHCFVKIAQGCCLCGEQDRAAFFHRKAMDVYHAHAAKAEAAPVLGAPYCGGFEYDPSDFDAAAADAGDGFRIRELARRIGGPDAGDVAVKYNTWLPTVLEVEDALEDAALGASLEQAREEAPRLLRALADGARDECLAILRKTPLAAFIGEVVDPGLSIVCTDGARPPFVVQDSPYTDAMLRRVLPSPAPYPHLRLHTDLSPAEVAMCHGNSWDARARRVRLPLAEAVKCGDRALVSLLLELGCDPNSCSPDDMRTPLMMAVAAEDWDMAVLLLHHPQVELDWSPTQELVAVRKGALLNIDVSLRDIPADRIPRFCCFRELKLSELLPLCLRQPVEKALEIYDRHSTYFLTRLREEGGEADVAGCFGAGRPWRPRLEVAVTQLLAGDGGESMVPRLLRLLGEDRVLELACTTDSTDLFSALLGETSLDVNRRYDGKLLCSHHIARGNTDIIAILCELPGLDEHMLSAEERRTLDEILDRW
eukprot:TRINITY_DN3453_c5_g1_i1.p1 TRINITY_DN3453_c5_g1~~TRINITY_DN3453_c5_g1_i1.p1  ORF type:complete len:788 (+),score=260.44 TRINITY_DN3453_c5_g1_i1:61-2364(+)